MSETRATPALRVLHVFPSFELGGSQSRTARLVDGLGDDFEHRLISLSGREEAAALLAHRERLTLLPPPRRAGSLATARALAACLRRERPELVLTYNFGSLDAQVAARLARVPAVHHEDGFGPDEALRRKRRRNWARRLALRGAAHVIVPSLNLERIARAEWGLSSPRLVCVPNGIDLERFEPLGPRADLAALGLDPSAPVIAALGTLRREKNLERLIGACERLPAELGAQLVLIGDGPERSGLEQRAARSRAAARIRFAGAQADPAPWLRAATLFALSSDTEQMPLSLVEAMAAGLPVAATDVGDVRHVLPDEQAAFLLPLPPPGAPREAGAEGLATALAALLSSAELRARLGRANRARAQERYAFATMLARYRALYRAAAGGA